MPLLISIIFINIVLVNSTLCDTDSSQKSMLDFLQPNCLGQSMLMPKVNCLILKCRRFKKYDVKVKALMILGSKKQLNIQMQKIQALRFDVEEVGKHVKGSKKRYCWDLALNQKTHTLVLDFSFISGKVKITVDRKILLQNDLPADVSFQYPFKLDGFALNIIQQGESFELRINNKVFSHLYTQQRTKAEFKNYDEEVKDIKVDFSQLNPQNKKISLNIGAFGPNLKKKKEVSQSSTSWNAFAGGSFPSYFGENEPQNVVKAKPPQGNLLEEQDFIAQKASNELNLLQNATVEKKVDIFDLASNEPEKETANTSKQFANMQDMFSSLSASNNKSNEIDFFADQPPSTISVKKQETKKYVEIKQPSSMFGFGQQSSGLDLTGFATGFGMEINPQANHKSFATISNTGNKGFDLSSLDLSINPPQPQQPAPNAFKKQGDLTYNQLENAFQPLSNPSNDFASLNMFPSPAFHQEGLGQQKQVFATNQGLQFNFTQMQSGRGEQFNTMPNMYQNKPMGELNFNLPVEQPPKNNPLDMFSNNKPATFATLSGANNNSNLDFDMNTFGTMQVKGKGSAGGELNFFDPKGTKPSTSLSGDLI